MNKTKIFGILTLLSAFAVQALAQTLPTNGLVAYYPFYGSATNGYGSGGTVNGGAISLTTNFFGNSNSALHFGGGSYISVTPTPININSNWTISFWCALDSGVTGANNFVSTAQDNQGGMNIRWDGDPTLPWELVANWYGNSGVSGCYGSSTKSPYNWNFVTCLKNGSTYEIFLDTNMIASNITTGTSVDNGSMWFGQHQSFAPYSLQGSLSDVFLYRRALSSAEIQQLYQYEIAPGAPTIISQPQSVTVNADAHASFSVSATGLTPLYYQWEFDGTNVTGATSSALMFTNVTQTNLGVYAVVVSNSVGSVVSSSANLSMYPAIHTPFTGGVAYLGGSDTLSVQAWGTGPLMYQWYMNGTAISNATNQNYTLSQLQLTNSGLYTVIVTSPLGSVTNTPEQVIVETAGVSLGLYPGVSITGVVGNAYLIQSAGDLSNTNGWNTVATLTLEIPTELWIDIDQNVASPTNRQHFYRVLPAP